MNPANDDLDRGFRDALALAVAGTGLQGLHLDVYGIANQLPAVQFPGADGAWTAGCVLAEDDVPPYLWPTRLWAVYRSETPGDPADGREPIDVTLHGTGARDGAVLAAMLVAAILTDAAELGMPRPSLPGQTGALEPGETRTPPDLADGVGRYFGHRKPAPGVVAAAVRDLGPDAKPADVAARIRAARKHAVNPAAADLGPAAGLDEAVTACYLNYTGKSLPPNPPYLEDPLAENSGGASWAEQQPAGTEVAVLESSYVTYRVIRADLAGGVRGCRVTAGWWD